VGIHKFTRLAAAETTDATASAAMASIAARRALPCEKKQRGGTIDLGLACQFRSLMPAAGSISRSGRMGTLTGGCFVIRYDGMYRSFFGSLCEMMPMCSRTFALVILYP
jgi:hypothetical protein